MPGNTFFYYSTIHLFLNIEKYNIKHLGTPVLIFIVSIQKKAIKKKKKNGTNVHCTPLPK